MTRIQRGQLANVKIDYGDLDVSETYPARLPELWAGRPVIVYGRYNKGGQGKITISGNVEGEAVSWPLEVTLSAEQPEHDVLAKVWAREKIEDLMQSTYYGGSPAVEEEVTALALQYRLMSQYTSFVAVDAEKAGEIEAAGHAAAADVGAAAAAGRDAVRGLLRRRGRRVSWRRVCQRARPRRE